MCVEMDLFCFLYTCLFSTRCKTIRNLRGFIFVFFVLNGLVYTRIYLVIRKLIRVEKRQVRVGGENQVKRQIICESRRARSCFL